MKVNPFQKLSNLLINNQQNFNQKAQELRMRSRSLSEKLSLVVEELEEDAFTADLTNFINLTEEANLILMVAKEVESHKEKIESSIEMLEKSNVLKLNK